MKKTTKKMLASISYQDFKTSTDEFVVPAPENITRLIGIKSNKVIEYGIVSYIGVEINSEDIIKKMKKIILK